MEFLMPSNDKSGVTDYTNITNELNNKKFVMLGEGKFYINQPIIMKNNYCVTGISENNTEINVVGDINAFVSLIESSCNAVSIKNLKVIAEANSTKYAIDLKGSLAQPYTGATHSNFENIYIVNFESGIFINHCWNTRFINIRAISCITNGIYLGGGCNNILCDMFIANGISTGIRVTTSDEDTTENTNIKISNADVEYCDKGIYIYNANNVSVEDIYSEHCAVVVYSYGCNGFSVNGFYSSNDIKFVETYNDGFVGNGFIGFDSSDNVSVIDSPNNIILDVTNIKTKNKSTGKVFYYKQNMVAEKPINGVKPLYSIESEPFRMRYSSDVHTFEFKTFDNTDKQYFCCNPSLIVVNEEDLKALSSDSITLYKNGVAQAVIEIMKDDVLSKNRIYRMRKKNQEADNFIYKNGDVIEIKHSNTTGVDVKLVVRFTDVMFDDFYFD